MQYTTSSGSSLEFFFGWGEGPMASAVREPITGVWGRSPQRSPGAEPLVRGQGGELSSHEAETLLALGRSLEAANLSTFLKFGNPKITHICVVFAKMKLRYRTDYVN